MLHAEIGNDALYGSVACACAVIQCTCAVGVCRYVFITCIAAMFVQCMYILYHVYITSIVFKINELHVWHKVCIAVAMDISVSQQGS